MVLGFQSTITPLITIYILSVWLLALNSSTPGRGEDSNQTSTSCLKTCGTGKSTNVVQYPFGFSKGCQIQLNCSSFNNSIELGGFQVQNITSDGIVLDVPAQCNRSIESISSLFGSNYALAWRNSLLLQNCSKTNSSCSIPMNSFLSQLDASGCDSGSDNISCYSSGRSDVDVYSFENINSSGCKFLFSSFAYGGGDNDEASFVFQRFDLEWWLQGSCSSDMCSKDGNCTEVRLGGDSGVGFRCKCNDGFVGDGFSAGSGCRRASDCNASKYMDGKCGGTTRVDVLVGGLVAGASLMAGLALLYYFYRRRRSRSLRNMLSAKRLISEAAGNSGVPLYQYKEIERATNGFSENQRLGTGAYGTVYAGKLSNDEWVAIKRIRHKDTDSIEQVMNEIKLLSSVSHPNLVRLLGCCIEEGAQILVYEFMQNGTLCEHLQRERGNGLPWTIRLTIAAETADAIAYLHTTMNPPIYHRDIKSSNILLDFNYKSKVADFGLSRLGMTESSHISTAPQGTPGYVDPQYHQYFHLSDKSDVYSFGVVLVEIITGLKVVDFSRSHSEVNLASLAVDRIGRGCVDEIIDPYLEPQRDAWTLSSIHKVAELAFRCLAFHSDMRPTMMEVKEELEQIRLSAWVPNMVMASSTSSSCSSENGSEKSLGVVSKKTAVGTRKVVVPQRKADSLISLAELKDGSPVSVHDPWQSEQSSPSTNSLLGSVVQ